MQKRFISSSIILLIIFMIGVFFVGLNKNSTYDTKGLVGKKITNIQLNHFNDKVKITEKDLQKNNFTLVNFWASWCAPCRDEHSFLLKLKNEKNLKILGVNFKDKKDNAIKFLNDLGDPYDILTRDEFGRQSVNFGIYGIPESILIDQDFIIIKKYIGPISNKDYKEIKKIVSE
tara:strand:- start:1342 stop:1863 length:522 start_codon:yes stop_codon:yes gene_type:complete